MRIAVGGFHLEASTYNPNLTKADEFLVVRGQGLLDSSLFTPLKEFDAEALPMVFARAESGAPMERGFYEALKAEILGALKALAPLDGVYFSLHGACAVEGMHDAEGDFLEAVRALVGPSCPIAASFDLHGNISRRVIDNLNIFSTYRTAPHIDQHDTMRRAFGMLMRSLKTGVSPKLCWSPIPVSLQGERTVTTSEPGKSLYAGLSGIDSQDGIWDASLMVGFVWADEPRVTAAAVMTGTDAVKMAAETTKLAQAYFDARNDFKFSMETGTIEECVDRAAAATSHPVFVSDSGDNVTAGGPGDRVDVLKVLLERKLDGVIVAAIVDREATDAAYNAGPGNAVSVSVGGSLVPTDVSPAQIDATVVRLLDIEDAAKREAVLQIGGVTLVVTASRRSFTKSTDFERLGLNPSDAKIVVVKLGYLFSELIPIAKTALMALSEGIVDQYVERLPRSLTPKPTFPFQTDFEYRPEVLWSKSTA